MAQLFGNSNHTRVVGVRPWSEFNVHTWAPGREMRSHGHDYVQVIHVVAGRLEVEWGDGWRSLAPGHVHVLPPGCEHALRTPSGHEQFGLNFMNDRDDRGVLDVVKEAFPEPTTVPAPFRTEWREAFSPTVAVGRTGRLRVLHALDAYCIALVEAADPRGPRGEARRLMEYLMAHAAESVRVDDAARAIHVSRATAQRICQRAFGCGVSHLHERLRLERASQMLVETELTIGECAQRCGYADIFQFSRAFKRARGASPRSFRSRVKQGHI